MALIDRLHKPTALFLRISPTEKGLLLLERGFKDYANYPRQTRRVLCGCASGGPGTAPLPLVSLGEHGGIAPTHGSLFVFLCLLWLNSPLYLWANVARL